MNDYDNKRAVPLTQYTYNSITKALNQWRNIIREELECLIYIKNNLQINQNNSNLQLNSSSSSINSLNYQDKVTNLIPKLENSCLKQIECINDFLTEIKNKKYKENSESIYNKVEAIRDNHNKLLVNIQKMLINIPILQQYVIKYKETILRRSEDEQVIQTNSSEENKEDIGNEQYNMMRFNEHYEEEKKEMIKNVQKINNYHHLNNKRNNKQTKKDFNKEWIDKLNKDIEEINKKNKTMSAMNSNHKMKKHFDGNYLGLQHNCNKNKDNNKNDYLSKNKSEYIITTMTCNNNNNKSNFNGSFRKNTPNNSFYHAKSGTNIFQKRYNNSNSKSKSKSPIQANKDKVIEQFKEEIKHIRSYCDNLEKEFKKHCLLSNEKKEFDYLKKENIKLIADVNILKEDVMDLLKKYQLISNKINHLEKENDVLKSQNQTLLNFISQQASSKHNNNNNINTNNNCNSLNDLVFSNSLLQTQQLLPNQTETQQNISNYKVINNNLDNLSKVMNEQISELSAFNLNNSNNNNNNISKFQNIQPSIQNEHFHTELQSNTINSNISNNNNNVITTNHSKSNSNVTNLTALTQINQSILSRDRSITPVKSKRRYLIPKSGE